MLKLTFITLLAFLMPSLASAQDNLPALETVSYVELDRYLGDWYEIAAIPQRFQRDCVHSRAYYQLNEDDTIKVTNICITDPATGSFKDIEGKAWVDDLETNAKLKVQFFWPFKGDYWIIELADDYAYAVVGAPNRDYLWILSRTPQMEDGLYNELMVQIKEQHLYDVSLIVKTQVGN